MVAPTLFRWTELPKQALMGGKFERTALRSDGALVTLNWFQPDAPRPEPHRHPFDQLSFVVLGTLVFEVDGDTIVAGPGTALRIPPDVPHTAYPKGDEVVLNIDVFAPVRADYLFLAAHQDGSGEGEPATMGFGVSGA